MMWLLVPIVPLVLGMLFAAAAAILAYPAWRMRQNWKQTVGTVVDVEEFKSGGETVRRLEIRFRDEQGRERTRTSPISWCMSRFEQGAEVPILYDPQNSAEIRIDTFHEIWLMPAAIGASGAVAALLGLCFAVGLARGA